MRFLLLFQMFSVRLGLVLVCFGSATSGGASLINTPNNQYNTQTTEPFFVAIVPSWLNASYSAYKNGDPVRGKIVDLLIASADKALLSGPYSVMHKKVVPISGDKHDYMSIGPYWWRDKTKPDGLPWIRRDGEVNPLSRSGGTDKPEMNKMFNAVSTLSLAYYYTKQEKYAKHAAFLINTWFIDPSTRMNPNLNFGQAVPGRADGRPYGIIETRGLIRLIDDMALLHGSESFTPMLSHDIKAWYFAYLTWLLTSNLGTTECNLHNNHGTYCEAQVAAFALFTGDKALAKKYIKRVQVPRMQNQITADGRQPSELARTRPLHYSLFNLEAYFYAARLGQQLDINLWQYSAPNGASIKKALDFLVPAINANGFWGEGVNTKMRKSRLYYFIQTAHQIYGDEQYAKALSDLIVKAKHESRNEMAQCFLIMPMPDGFTLEDFLRIDPKGKKSAYRCYY